MDDASPRPSLAHFALSTLIMGLGGVLLIFVFDREMTRGPYADYSIPVYSAAVIVTQGLACFGRVRWAAWTCTALVAIPVLLEFPGLIHAVSDREVPYRYQWILRRFLLVAIFGVATLANGIWARKLSNAATKPGFIRRYTFAELATVFTILCAVAAVAAKIYRDV